jgi:5'-3' exoribonuclease 2
MKRMYIGICLAAIGLGVAGCASPGVQTRKQAVAGSVVGAAVGGIVGHQSGRGLEGAAIGGALGGAAGAVHGSADDVDRAPEDYPTPQPQY